MTIVLLIILGLWIYGIYGVNFRDKNKGFLMRKEEEAAQKMYDTIIALTKEYHYKLIPFCVSLGYINNGFINISNKTNEEINYFLSYPKHLYKENDNIICNGIIIGKYEDLKKSDYSYYLDKYNNNIIINYTDLRKEVETIGSYENAFFKGKPKNNKNHDGNFFYKDFDNDIKMYSERFKDCRKNEGVFKEIFGDISEASWAIYKRKYKDISPEFRKLYDDINKAYKSGANLEKLENLTLEFYVKSNIEYFKTHKLSDYEIEMRKTAIIINKYEDDYDNEEIIENKSLLYDYENDKNKTKEFIIDNYNKNNFNIKERISDFAKEFKVNTYYSNY